MIFIPQKSKKKKSRMYAIASAAFASAAIVADVAYGAGTGAVDSTVEINDTTTNGPILTNTDFFGWSAANIGDLNGDGVNDLAVGAIWDDAGGTNRGAVHIMFMNTDGSVDSTVEINDNTSNGPILSNSDYFGNSITNIGDLNSDGVSDIVVGARKDDQGGSNRGAVHIMFMNTDGSVDSTVEINDSTANGPVLSDYDYFGNSIANIGDLNNDGVSDLAVGAYRDNEGGVLRGAVHIMFMNTDGTVDSTVEINDTTANGPVLGDADNFGTSIANIGDLNSDGVSDLAVGARNDDEGGGNRGAVHIMFMNTDGTVDSTVEINDTTTNGPVLSNGDYFGWSTANIGDLNGDGVNDLAVGAFKDDEGGSARGAVHIMFMNTDGTVDSTVEINDTTTNGPVLSNNDSFGSSIANMGDLDGNDVNDLVVGAYNDDAGGGDRGAVHVIFMYGDSINPTISTLSPLDNATDVSTTANLVITFDEDVNKETGNITIKKSSDNSTVETIDVTTAQVSGDGTDTITINPSVTLDESTEYYIQIDATAFDDLAGNSFAGISNTTSWSFTTITTTVPGSSGGGRSSKITSSCTPSDRTVSVGDKVSFDIDIDTTEDSYTFKWTKVLSGDDEEETYTFTEEGKFYPRAEAKDSAGNKTTVNCGTITVEGDDDTDEDNDNDKEDDEKTQKQQSGSGLSIRDLELGMEGEDVKLLQKLLNSLGYTLALSGPGSPNNETDFFGTLTKNALAKYQLNNNITPSVGYFGPKTRAQMKSQGLKDLWW